MRIPLRGPAWLRVHTLAVTMMTLGAVVAVPIVLQALGVDPNLSIVVSFTLSTTA